MTSHTSESYKTASTAAMSKACLQCLAGQFDQMKQFLTEMENYSEYQNPIELLKEKQHLPPQFLALAYDYFGEQIEVLLPLEKALKPENNLSEILQEKLKAIAEKLTDPMIFLELSTRLRAESPPIEGSFQEYTKACEESIAVQQSDALNRLLSSQASNDNGVCQASCHLKPAAN